MTDKERRERNRLYQQRYSERHAAELREYRKKYKAEHADKLREKRREHKRKKAAEKTPEYAEAQVWIPDEESRATLPRLLPAGTPEKPAYAVILAEISTDKGHHVLYRYPNLEPPEFWFVSFIVSNDNPSKELKRFMTFAEAQAFLKKRFKRILWYRDTTI